MEGKIITNFKTLMKINVKLEVVIKGILSTFVNLVNRTILIIFQMIVSKAIQKEKLSNTEIKDAEYQIVHKNIRNIIVRSVIPKIVNIFHQNVHHNFSCIKINLLSIIIKTV